MNSLTKIKTGGTPMTKKEKERFRQDTIRLLFEDTVLYLALFGK